MTSRRPQDVGSGYGVRSAVRHRCRIGRKKQGRQRRWHWFHPPVAVPGVRVGTRAGNEAWARAPELGRMASRHPDHGLFAVAVAEERIASDSSLSAFTVVAASEAVRRLWATAAAHADITADVS